MAGADIRRVGRAARWGAVAIAAGLFAVLLTAAWLTPAPGGHATHTQLGLPECGWVMKFGKPCPTCGMTTAFAWAAHGDFVRSFLAQPFAAVLVVVSAAGFWGAVHVAATGSRIGDAFAAALRPRLLWVLAATVLAAWAYKFVTWN